MMNRIGRWVFHHARSLLKRIGDFGMSCTDTGTEVRCTFGGSQVVFALHPSTTSFLPVVRGHVKWVSSSSGTVNRVKDCAL